MSEDRMIRVDMSTQTVSIETFPEKWKMLGGRALTARILLDECDPTCDPLGPDNVFILAPGFVWKVGPRQRSLTLFPGINSCVPKSGFA